MALLCPQCRHPLPPADINVATDAALCRRCGHAGTFSALVHPESVSSSPSAEPPAGAWRHNTFEGVTVGATTRSRIAWFLVPFMLVWSGGSLGGIYGTQFVRGEFNLFMSLFGLPFVAGSVLFWGLTAMALVGRVEVKVRSDGRGEIFTGVARWGRRQRFDLAAVDRITINPLPVNYPGKQGPGIVLEGQPRLTFGSNLTPPRRDFIAQTLRGLHPGTGRSR